MSSTPRTFVIQYGFDIRQESTLAESRTLQGSIDFTVLGSIGC